MSMRASRLPRHAHQPLLRLGLAALVLLAGAFGTRLPAGGADVRSAQAGPPPSPEQVESGYLGAPDDLTKAVAMAQAWIQAGKRERAAKVLRERLAARPDDPVAAFTAGFVEGGEAGCATMWAAVRRHPVPTAQEQAFLVSALGVLADVEEARGRPDLAVLALEQQVTLEPSASRWLHLGWQREQAGMREGAEQAYRQARALAPEDPRARQALALLLARSPGKGREARKLAEEGTTQRPEAAESWLYLGMVKALAGDTPGALVAYQSAFERAGRDAATLTALGAAYGAIEQWELAQKALAAAVALDAERSDAVLQAAALAVQREQWAEAKKLLAQAARLEPKSAQVSFLQGVVAQRTEQVDGAIQAYRKAVQLEPTSSAYALALVGALLERGNLDAALAALKDAAEACPQEPGIPLRQGFVLMQKKKWAQAADAFRRAARLAPKDPDPHLYLAVILGDHLDNVEQARMHLEQYKALGGKEPSALAWLAALGAR
jgi:Flp pilus assembly protein TadD